MSSSTDADNEMMRENEKLLAQTSIDIVRAKIELKEVYDALMRIDGILVAWPRYYPRHRESLNDLVSTARKRVEELLAAFNDINNAIVDRRKYERYRYTQLPARIQFLQEQKKTATAKEMPEIDYLLYASKAQYAWPWYQSSSS